MRPNPKVLHIDITDMGCEACSALVGRALAAIPGAAGGPPRLNTATYLLVGYMETVWWH
jgi:hypothetical protein